MSESKHALLSASSAYRWRACPLYAFFERFGLSGTPGYPPKIIKKFIIKLLTFEELYCIICIKGSKT